MESMKLLEVKGISLDFGGHRALSDVTCHVSDGEILGLIGPNGAGKTCVLNCATMFYKPHLGQVFFQGKDITGYKTHQIADLGIARTFQNIELFSGLTVLENLMVGRHIRMKAGTTACSLYFGRARAEEIRHREVVEDIIDLLEMEAIRNKKVGSLPYGQRKRVDLGRALAMEPKLLLLDEPLAGMNVEEKEDMVRFVMDVYELKKTSIILVEHDMGVVMDLVHRLVVLDFGVKIADGPPERIKQDEGVIKAYLGSSAAEHGTKTL